MNCLTKQQLIDYLQGMIIPGAEDHLAQCGICRAALVALHANKAKNISISQDLIDKTVTSMLAANTSKTTSLQGINNRLFYNRRIIIALAAAIILCFTAITYFIGRNETSSTSIAYHPDSSASFALKKEPFDSGPVSRTLQVWLDTEKIKDAKEVKKNIWIRPHQENIIRLGAKTGIVIEPSTVLHTKTRTDTSVEIELTRGSALFTVEKNRFRRFSVQTPHIRILVTGTIFSVAVDSNKTTVKVIEGSVQLQREEKLEPQLPLKQGHEAVAAGDSIDATTVMNTLTAKKRGRMLRDYIQSTIFSDDIHTIHDTASITTPDK